MKIYLKAVLLSLFVCISIIANADEQTPDINRFNGTYTLVKQIQAQTSFDDFIYCNSSKTYIRTPADRARGRCWVTKKTACDSKIVISSNTKSDRTITIDGDLKDDSGYHPGVLNENIIDQNQRSNSSAEDRGSHGVSGYLFNRFFVDYHSWDYDSDTQSVVNSSRHTQYPVLQLKISVKRDKKGLVLVQKDQISGMTNGSGRWVVGGEDHFQCIYQLAP